jgi:periplasmic protein TonB
LLILAIFFQITTSFIANSSRIDLKTGPARSWLEDYPMIESTARAERYEVSSEASPAFLWEVPQKPVSARIPFGMIDRLEQEAVENFRSLSSRGSEIGGVLLGKAIPGAPAVVWIQDYELIPCDYSRGPLYRLSDADLDKFARAIARHTASGGLVVGYFRSHTRKGLSMDPEDLALFDTQFPAPHHIVLLVRPFATKASQGGIFIREEGTVRLEASHREFPFRSALLTVAPAAGAPPEAGAAPPLPPTLQVPAAPKPAARAQIVPIAPRREMASPMPAIAAEPQLSGPPSAVAPAPPVVEAAAPPATPPQPVQPAAEAPPAPHSRAAEPPAAPPVPEPVVAPPAPVLTAPVTAPPVPAPLVVAAPPATAPSPVPETRPAVSRTAVEPEPAEPAVEPESRRSGKLMWMVAGVAAVVVLVVALFVYPGVLRRSTSRPPTASAPQDSSPLGLRVQRLGGELLLSWNRDADLIRNAARGILSISDGDQHENVSLDVAQLQIGSIEYTPATGDVVFTMEVTAKSGARTTSDLIRSLQLRPSPMPQAGQPAAIIGTKGTPAAPGTPAAGTPGSVPPAADQPPAEETAKAPERVLRPFRTEALSQRLRPTPAADLPDAPSLGGTAGAGSTSISGLNMNPAAPPPPAPAPASAATPAAAPKAGGNIRQAVLIHKKDPDYPKIARDAGAKGTVSLVATIGVDGRVKQVTDVKGHPMLVKAASDAVMQWIYSPTLLNGTAVEGQVQVQVNFLGR